MKELEKARKDYENIKSSPQLMKSVQNTIKKQSAKTIILKSFASAAACFILVSVLAVNLSDKLAYAMSDIPVLSSVVRVITFGRYENSDNGYEAKVFVPKIEGLLDKELEYRLNNEFRENADSVIAAYERDVNALKEEFGDETIHMSIESNYEIKTDNDDILALDVYIFYASGSSSTKHSFYTIDKKTGELLTLKGLFKKDADYVSVLSEYIKGEMKRLNEEEEGMFWIDGEEDVLEGFAKISPEQNFYINDAGNIVICFDKYEVAAGAQGSPEFEIPSDVIKDIRK